MNFTPEVPLNGPAYKTLTDARLLMSRAGPGLQKLVSLERAAKMMAMPVRHGGIHKTDVVDSLLAEADAIGLIGDTSEDVVTETIARGLEDFSLAEGQDLPKPTISAPNGRALVTCNLSDIAPEKIEWLWPSRIAIGKLTLIAGEPGLGKSQVALRIAATVTTGGKWPDCESYAPSGSVIILSAEDGIADTLRPRFEAAGGDSSRVTVIKAVEAKDSDGATIHGAFNLAQDLALLEAEIKRRGDVRLVKIDPISSYMGKTDSHKNSDVRGVLEPIANLAERLRVAIVGVTHLSKGDGRAINRVIGSIAFVAASRAAFTVVNDPEDDAELRKLFLQVKNNISAPAPGLAFRLEQREIKEGIIGSAVVWDSSLVTIKADEALAAHTATGNHTATDDAVEFLSDVLAAGSMPVKEIERLAVGAGLLEEGKLIGQCKAFRQARKRLGIAPQRTGGTGAGGQWVWALPVPQMPKVPSPAYDAPFPEVGTLGHSGHLSDAEGSVSHSHVVA